jgi:glycosyltransferase involved in cell wall biosynthesis
MGGAEESVISLAMGMAKRGHKCHIATVVRRSSKDDNGKDQTARLLEAGIQYYELGGANARLSAIYTPFRLLALIRKLKPTIVHSTGDIPNFMVSIALRLRQFPVARSIRNPEMWPCHRKFGFLCESAFQRDMVVFVSQSTKTAYRNLRRKYQLPESKYQYLIHNAIWIPSKDYYTDRPSVVARVGAKPDKFLICYAGRFEHQKGFDVLLESIKNLPSCYVDQLELHAFGFGEQLQEYRHLALSKNLPVKFHKPVAKISQMFTAFDAVVLPSRSEGLPRVALEVLAAGVPLVATCAPGVREALPPNWPLRALPGDPLALSDKLITVIDRHYDQRALQKLSEIWIHENFHVSKMINAYEQAYEHYLKSSRGSVSKEH